MKWSDREDGRSLPLLARLVIRANDAIRAADFEMINE